MKNAEPVPHFDSAERLCSNKHKLSWADRRFGCAKCGKRKCRKAKIRLTQRHDYRDYREDLARFPNDPQAYVNSDGQVKKLIDQRKREGWTFRKDGLADAWDSIPKDDGADGGDMDDEAMVEEAFREAMEGECRGL